MYFRRTDEGFFGTTEETDIVRQSNWFDFPIFRLFVESPLLKHHLWLRFLFFGRRGFHGGRFAGQADVGSGVGVKGKEKYCTREDNGRAGVKL